MAERLYVSNKNETVRMFESDFMEFFSRVHPVTPLVLYLPVVSYMLYVSLWHRQLTIVAVTGLAVSSSVMKLYATKACLLPLNP